MKKIFGLTTTFLFPVISFAQSCNISNARDFKGLVTILITCFLNPIAALLVGVAVLVFIYGVSKFVQSEGDDKQAGKELMIWGVIGIFVIVSLWGLVNILENTFTLDNNSIHVPNINVPGF